MTQSQSNAAFFNNDRDSIPDMHRFCHEAMATGFEILIVHQDGRYARQAAQAAFAELDRLEAELSRFIENSDISRINARPANQPVRIGLAALQCLQLARQVYNETGGAFDITIGPLVDYWQKIDKAKHRSPRQQLNPACWKSGMRFLELDETRCSVVVLTESVQIDLGGIGKGFAVDQMGQLMHDWGIDAAVIHSGGSSVLALDPPPGRKGFAVTLSNPCNRKETLARLYLQRRALSGSGMQKGRHIIDPRTAQPVTGRLAAWSCASTAAMADGLSTAFMVMSDDEIKQYCRSHPNVRAMVILKQRGKKNQILSFGPWAAGELLNR